MTFRSYLHRLHWLVMACFFLSLGSALAAPLVKPRTMDLVCTGSGATVLVHADGDGAGTSAMDADCLLCLVGAAQPAGAPAAVAASPCHASQPATPAAEQVIARAASPPPARAPPFCVFPS
jgi:hypothetical protein